jgi:hypothetical protein
MNDVMRPYVPEYRGQVISDDGDCILFKIKKKLAKNTE